MSFDYVLHGQTSIGRRRTENQDRFVIRKFEAKGLQGEYLAAVADGMGGVHGGATASKIALETLVEEFTNNHSLNEKIIAGSICRANDEIFAKGSGDPQLAGMGTTIVGICSYKKNCYVFHVGDSRAYRIRGKNISKLTSDHTLVNELIKAGTITEEQAKTHPVSHMLTRSLGPANKIECDVREISSELQRGDKILLCSDGLYGMISDEKILELASAEHSDPDKRVESLLDAANEAGGTDNITVIIAELQAASTVAKPKAKPIIPLFLAGFVAICCAIYLMQKSSTQVAPSVALVTPAPVTTVSAGSSSQAETSAVTITIPATTLSTQSVIPVEPILPTGITAPGESVIPTKLPPSLSPSPTQIPPTEPPTMTPVATVTATNTATSKATVTATITQTTTSTARPTVTPTKTPPQAMVAPVVVDTPQLTVVVTPTIAQVPPTLPLRVIMLPTPQKAEYVVPFDTSTITTTEMRDAKISKVLEAKTRFKQEEPMGRLRKTAELLPEFKDLITKVDSTTDKYVATQQKAVLLPNDKELQASVQRYALERAKLMDTLSNIIDDNLSTFERTLQNMSFDLPEEVVPPVTPAPNPLSSVVAPTNTEASATMTKVSGIKSKK